MYDFVQDRYRAGITGGLAQDDEEYDTYLFWSSTGHMVRSSWDSFEVFEEHHPETRFNDQYDTTNELDSPYFQPLSPTYSIDSNFLFPDVNSERNIGILEYSRLFRSGLFLRSRNLTRRFDYFMRRLFRRLEATKRWFSRWWIVFLDCLFVLVVRLHRWLLEAGLSCFLLLGFVSVFLQLLNVVALILLSHCSHLSLAVTAHSILSILKIK